MHLTRTWTLEAGQQTVCVLSAASLERKQPSTPSDAAEMAESEKFLETLSKNQGQSAAHPPTACLGLQHPVRNGAGPESLLRDGSSSRCISLFLMSNVLLCIVPNLGSGFSPMDKGQSSFHSHCHLSLPWDNTSSPSTWLWEIHPGSAQTQSRA